VSVPEDKARTRARARETLEAIDAEERSALSRRIVGHLVASDLWRRSRTVLAYLAMPSEVDLDELFRAREGRTVGAPRADWTTRSMTAARVDGLDDLREVRPGLREPSSEAPMLDSAGLDLVLVPGLAFDAAGRRLGRGAGFYDRFLAGLPRSSVTVGVCFRCQMIDRVPSEGHDVGVRMLLGEDGLRPAAGQAPDDT
jgi:5-formyltetrahydrofolate cyclo-ligase